MAETPSNEQEKQVKKLKRRLEGWREAIIPVHSVLLWEKQWYPGLIFGTVTFIYTLMWLIDPSILTILSSVGIIVTVSDFIVPTLIANVHLGGQWTGYREKLYEDICRNLVCNYNWIHNLLSNYLFVRESSPRLFYSSTVSALGFFTWIGSTVNNTLLCYFITLTLALLPGFQQRELPKHFVNGAFSVFNGMKKDS